MAAYWKYTVCSTCTKCPGLTVCPEVNSRLLIDKTTWMNLTSTILQMNQCAPVVLSWPCVPAPTFMWHGSDSGDVWVWLKKKKGWFAGLYISTCIHCKSVCAFHLISCNVTVNKLLSLPILRILSALAPVIFDPAWEHSSPLPLTVCLMAFLLTTTIHSMYTHNPE